MNTPVPSVPHEPVAPVPEAKPEPTVKPVAAVKPAKAPGPKPSKPAGAQSPVVSPAVSETPAISGAQAARDLRKQRARKLLMGISVWVGLPVLLACIYYGALAQPQFEAVASFAVRGTNMATRAAMLREYIASPEMLAALDKKHKFSTHLQHSKDPLARLSSGTGSVAHASAYRDHVKTEYDAPTGLFVVRVRAFSGAKAAAVAGTIVKESSRLFVRIEGDSSAQRLKAAEADLAAAREHLIEAERALAELEAAPGVVDPARVVATRVLQTSRQFADREADAALTALSKVRAHVRSRETPLVTISKPKTPSEAAYPRRLYGVLTVLFVSLSLFGVGRLLVSAVREHAQF